MRLQRYLAMNGVASRRKSEDLIAAGLVAVNGRVVTEQGTTVDPASDKIAVRGRLVGSHPRASAKTPLVVALHKPRGVITARAAHGEPTVYELIEEPPGTRMIYVGRLDRDSEGLLLFTRDGTLAHRLTHPSWEVERTYEAWVSGTVDDRALQRAARQGVVLDDGERTAPFRARSLGRGPRGTRKIELVLTEGRKREVRRIVEALGAKVERLVRTRYGTMELEGIAPGKWRSLTRLETARLFDLVELGAPAGSARRS